VKPENDEHAPHPKYWEVHCTRVEVDGLFLTCLYSATSLHSGIHFSCWRVLVVSVYLLVSSGHEATEGFSVRKDHAMESKSMLTSHHWA
jgi:hypothetical protein